MCSTPKTYGICLKLIRFMCSMPKTYDTLNTYKFYV
jgi:hypothetical protein